MKRWAPFTGTNYEIGVTISGKPVEIYALLGGQWPHSSYMVPGGVMCAPTLTDVTRAWSILEYFRRDWIEKIWLGCSMERYEEIKIATTISWPGSTSGRSTPTPISASIGGWRMDVGARQVWAGPRPIHLAGAICRTRTNTRSRPSTAATPR